MNNQGMTPADIRAFFEKTRLRKYNLTFIFRFLETYIYDNLMTPNFDTNDYMDFSKDFDECLNILKPNAKQIIIDKFGLIDGVVKSASEVALNNKLTSDGVNSSVYNSINYLKQSGGIIKLRRYFDFRQKQTSEKQQQDIDFVLQVMKELEEENKHD